MPACATMLAALCLFSLTVPANGADDAIVARLSAQAYEAPEREGFSTERREAAHPITGEPTEALAVTGRGAEGHLILTLGWVEVEPQTQYRARYHLRPTELAGEASLYLQVRERAARDGPPLTPYPRPSPERRAVDGDQGEQWLERSLRFTSKEETHWLELRLVITELEGTLLLSDLVVFDAALHDEAREAEQKRQLARQLERMRAAAAEREPQLERPLVFSRGQMKYGLERSYYEHEYDWLDRPLFVNRAYRVPQDVGFGPSYLYPIEPEHHLPRRHLTTLPSYTRTVKEAASYDIDGLAFFPLSRDRMSMFELAERAAAETDLDVGLLPEFLPGQEIEAYQRVLERALASDVTPRINGKVLITSYAAAGNTPERWDEILTALRDRYGESFIFLPALTSGVGLRGPYRAGDHDEFTERLEGLHENLRAYLEVTDGIYFNYPAALRQLRVMPRPFDREFYEDVFIPAWGSLLAEPEFEDKYFGLSAYKSHMMPERGNNLYEDGTRTLRHSFEPAMAARPDVLILPEWDEQNENTSWRPTMYGSTTSQRIVRYYMSRIKDTGPTPVPGDDESVPNLIFSARKMATLGETVMIELLNVPDTAEAHRYTVDLTIEDQDGRELESFESVTFDAAELQEERFHIQTEAFPAATALVPVLRVHDYQGGDIVYEEGLPHVKLRATWNWNHLYQKQPLRELVRPTAFRFEADDALASDGSLSLEAQVESPEPLSLVEIVADDNEVYAFDPDDEFFRNDPDRGRVMITYRSVGSHDEIEGTLTLRNAGADWTFQGPMLHRVYPEIDLDADAGVLHLNSGTSIHNRWIHLAIPTEEAADAELEFAFDKASFTLPVAEVLERGKYVHAGEGGLRIAVSPFVRQLDLPYPLERSEASFRTRVWPQVGTEQYHVRVTTVNGRTFRSRPLSVPGSAAGERTPIRVHSDHEGRAVDLEVDASRVPQVAYRFDPAIGAGLLTDAGTPFRAALGGYVSQLTGRGAATAIHRRDYPHPIVPQWVEEDGETALHFDGEGMFAKLPLETLPRRSAFTVELEIKPTGDDDSYPLLMNRIHTRQKGLGLEVRDGKLRGSFRPDDWQTEHFVTDLEVPSGEWSRIRVVYDHRRMRFIVNGQEEAFEFAKPGTNNGYTLIGDGWRDVEDSFEGYLRHLAVYHHANEE